jgi:diguanylate cyclase (GGDEF)-like protein/PAS domain S-box-containing protein
MKTLPKSSASNPVGKSSRVLRVRHYGTVIVLLVFLLSLVYLHFAWGRYERNEISKIINLGDTVGALLNTAQIRKHSNSGAEASAEQNLYPSLIRMVKVNTSIAHAYLVELRDGEIVFLLDSGPAPLTRKASPGHIFQDERILIETAWSSAQTTFTGTVVNSRGEWISTLTPIRDEHTNETVAVLGITYPLAPWNYHIMEHITTDVLVVLSLLILSVGLMRIFTEHARLRDRGDMLARDEALFHSVFEQAPVGISIVGDNRITYTSPDTRYSVNRMFETILGRDKAELEQTDWQAITHPDDLQPDLALLARYKAGEIDHYTLEKRFIRPNGSLVWTNLTIGSLTGSPQHGNMHLCILEDISARKRAEQSLRESERSKTVLLSHLPGLAYRCKYDHNWTMEFVSEGCEALTGYAPECLVDNRDLSYNDLVAPEYRDLLWAEWEQVLHQKRHFRYEYELITRDGSRKWVLELGQFIFAEDGSIAALEGIVIDISEQKAREAQITYLSEHDYLTGLNNRNYFEIEKKRFTDERYLPLSIMVCDINGVRLINDAFGPAEGDRLISDVAHMLQSLTRDGDVLCRTGGDEFTLLLPNAGEEQIDALCQRITHAVERYNQSNPNRPFEASVSFGFSTLAVGTGIDQTVASAEERLKHRKLLNQKSSHSAILSSIMATLYARSQETEEHGKRLTRLTRLIGERIGLDAGTLDDLELLSMLHDIGKVGVDDRILNKPAHLTPDEWVLMKRHSEIGYRIALSSPELEHIAVYILYHHEQWDGYGYPTGLKGEEIPLPARILTVADAYDAMIEDRVYRQAMPKADALAEIRRCAGTQFDPDVARIFLALMEQAEPDAAAPPHG